MSLVLHYSGMARYNAWMNEKLLTVCDTLSDAELRSNQGLFFKSVLATLNHLLLADRAWMLRFTKDRERYVSRNADGSVIQITGLDHMLYSDWEAFKAERRKTDADIDAWVEELDEQSLLEHIVYKTSTGLEFDHPMWQAVSHLFNHQTHHRGQVTAALTRLGKDPGVTDIAVMFRG